MLFRPHERFSNNPHYRADIDGLRALSVALVILFHLGLPSFSGGYLGVDIFFVITGYLITGHIKRDVAHGGFSFLAFYERRAKRLLPALFCVLAFSMLLAALTMTPPDMLDASNAIAAAIFWVANIYFYFQDSYFVDAETNPFIHLWSLGVEEQFYLFWPIACIALLRYVHRAPWAVLLAMILIGTGVIRWLGTVDSDAAFYMMPARIPEFLLGAILCWLPSSDRLPRLLRMALPIAGLALIAFGTAMATPQTPTLSIFSWACCVGAALIIYAGNAARISALLLGNRLCAYLGRISYELYLFHWPLIAFYSYTQLEAVPVEAMPWLVLGMVVLSVITYHAISCPLRYGFKETVRQRENVAIGFLSIALVMLCLMVSVRLSGGWEWRIPESRFMFTKARGEFHAMAFGGAGYLDGQEYRLGAPGVSPSFVLFGDSFAAQYGRALDAMLNARNQSAILLADNGCLVAPHLTTMNRGNPDPMCESMFERVRALLTANPLPIIHAQSWMAYKENTVTRDGTPVHFAAETNDGYYAAMMEVLEKTRIAFAHLPYAFVGVQPGISEKESLTKCLHRPNILPSQCDVQTEVPEGDRLHGQEFNTAAQAYVQQHPEVVFINPRRAMCKNGMCRAIDNGKIFYSDLVHFTVDGAMEVITLYDDTFFNRSASQRAVPPQSATPTPSMPAQAAP